MKTKLRLVSSLIAVAAVIGAGNSYAQSNPITIKLAHLFTSEHSIGASAAKFKELLEKKAPGRIKVELFPNALLGGERDVAESVLIGNVQMAVLSTAIMANYSPSLGIYDLPYIVKGFRQAEAAYSGPIQERLNADMLKKGIRILTMWHQGFRGVVSAKRPIRTIEDFKGFKIRVPEGPVYVGTFKLLGANPTPIPFNEVYTAIQTGVVDGMEGSAETLNTIKIYEVAKYFTLTNHIYSGQGLMINEKFYESLSPDLQKDVNEAAQEATAFEWRLVKDRDAENLNLMRKNGMTIISVSPIEIKKMQDAVKPLWQAFGQRIGPVGIDLINQFASMKD